MKLKYRIIKLRNRARNEISDFSQNPTLSFCTKYTEMKKIERRGIKSAETKNHQ